MEKLIKEALQGTGDYHALMRSIAVSSLRRKAGYVPPKMDAPPEDEDKNFVHWQSSKYDISAGVWWIFYATAAGHFRPRDAKLIWRYGQSLKLLKRVIYHLRAIDCQDFIPFVEHHIKNPVLLKTDKPDVQLPHLSTAFNYDYVIDYLYHNIKMRETHHKSVYSVPQHLLWYLRHNFYYLYVNENRLFDPHQVVEKFVVDTKIR